MLLYLPETYRVLGLADANGEVALELVDAAGTVSRYVLGETWERGMDDFGPS